MSYKIKNKILKQYKKQRSNVKNVGMIKMYKLCIQKYREYKTDF